MLSRNQVRGNHGLGLSQFLKIVVPGPGFVIFRIGVDLPQIVTTAHTLRAANTPVGIEWSGLL